MAKEISIEISARDHYSDAIKAMQSANRQFNKDLDGMQNKLDALDKTKTSLTIETDNAKKALQEAKKAFREMDDAAKDDSGIKIATENYKNAQRNLQLLAKEARNTEKDMESLATTRSKSENKAGIIERLGTAGITKMAGEAVSGRISAEITSALGSNIGNAVGTITSGMASGAAIGSMVAPGIGTAIGAGLGLLSGGLQAGTEYFTKQDDAFKGVVQDRYNAQQERINADLTAGSEMAAGRERDHISFTTLMGSGEEADKYLSWVRDTANNTPFQYEDLSAMSKTLSTYGYDPEQMKGMITAIGDTGATLGAEPYDMQMMIKGLGRMKQSGKTNLEYMNPMIERGVKVWDYLVEGLTESTGKQLTLEEVQRMSSNNEIDGAEAVEIIVAAMAEDNKGAMERHSQTYAGLQSTVDGLKKEGQAAMGEGYNEVRITGLKEDIEFYGGEEGTKLQHANKLMGQWKGKLENDRNAEIRKAESAALTQFENGEITGSQAGEIIARARANAEAEYMASTGMQQEIASQKALIEGIQNDTALKNEYWNTGMIMGDALSKGLSFALKEENTKKLQELAKTLYGVDPEKYKQAEEKKHSTKKIEDESGNRPEEHTLAGVPPLPNAHGTMDAGRNIPKKAFGMGYVPYNDFPALLHEGERVMTASENRAHNGGAAPTITITGNSFAVREEADVYAIAKEIARQVERARMLM